MTRGDSDKVELELDISTLVVVCEDDKIKEVDNETKGGCGDNTRVKKCFLLQEMLGEG